MGEAWGPRVCIDPREPRSERSERLSLHKLTMKFHTQCNSGGAGPDWRCAAD